MGQIREAEGETGMALTQIATWEPLYRPDGVILIGADSTKINALLFYTKNDEGGDTTVVTSRAALADWVHAPEAWVFVPNFPEQPDKTLADIRQPIDTIEARSALDIEGDGLSVRGQISVATHGTDGVDALMRYPGLSTGAGFDKYADFPVEVGVNGEPLLGPRVAAFDFWCDPVSADLVARVATIDGAGSVPAQSSLTLRADDARLTNPGIVSYRGISYTVDRVTDSPGGSRFLALSRAV